MSKKVKGQKLDLATFNGVDSANTMALPSGPNPNREPTERRGRRDFQNGGDQGRDGRMGRSDQRGMRDFDGGASWGRGESSSSMGGRRNDDFGDKDGWKRESGFGGGGGGGGGSFGRSDDYGRRDNFQSGGGSSSNLDDGDSWKRSNGGVPDFREQRDSSLRRAGGPSTDRPSFQDPYKRPDHMRMNLEPRRVGSGSGGGDSGSRYPSDNLGNNSNTASADADDKFSKSFSKFRGPSRQSNEMNNRDIDDNMNRLSMNQAPPLPSAVAPTTNTQSKPTTEVKKDKEETTPKVTGPTKKQLREEAERLAKAEKAAALEKQKQEAEANAALRKEYIQLSTEIVTTGKKGTILRDHIKSLAKAPTGSTLVYVIMNTSSFTHNDLKWAGNEEYGHALKHLLSNNISEQVETLFVIQEYCYTHKFPKIEMKGVMRSYIEVIFQLLYKYELIEDLAFIQWSDSDSDAPGRIDAIVQTTNFMNILTAEDDVDYDEEDDDEVDAPREIIK